jgi:hypothetical protein
MKKELPENNPATAPQAAQPPADASGHQAAEDSGTNTAAHGQELSMDPLTRQVMEQERAFLCPDEWGLDIRPVIAKYVSPPPNIDHLEDGEVRGYLRALVDVLARHHLALVNTNHLSDRELYYHILQHVIPRPIGIGPDARGAIIYHECCACDSEEYLMYYADDFLCDDCANDPTEPLPPKRELVADRDVLLELLAEAFRDQPLPDSDAP